MIKITFGFSGLAGGWPRTNGAVPRRINPAKQERMNMVSFPLRVWHNVLQRNGWMAPPSALCGRDVKYTTEIIMAKNSSQDTSITVTFWGAARTVTGSM